MIINHNIASLNTYGKLSANNAATSKSLEKLSSGLRINRAGDDAAGLAISEKMRGQIRGLDQATRNSQDGISLIQTAEGALNETHSILQRMRELAVQSSNDTNTQADRAEIQKEINQLTSEINRIGNTTEFNTQKLLNGDKANTLAVVGVKIAGSSSTTSYAMASAGLTAAFTTTNALASGTHTLDITVDRNTRADQDLAPKVAGFSGGTGTGDNVAFASNAITIAAGSVTASSTITLTYASATNQFHMTGTLTGAPGGNTAIDEYINVGEAYNNHGISFTITDTGTIATGETLQFKALAAGNTVGTQQVGYTATAGTTHATFGANASGYTGVTLQDTEELANLGGGSVKITLGSGSIIVEAYDGANGTGNKIISDTISGGTANYNQHGIMFNVTAAVTGAGDDVITMNISSDTYTINASLDGASGVALDSDYNGTATSGAVVNSAVVGGLSFNQTDAFAVGSYSYSFSVEQNITGEDKSATFQIGANTSQGMDVDISDMRAVALEITSDSASDTKSVVNSMGETVTAYYTATKTVTNGTNNTVAEYALDVSTGEKATAAIAVIDEAMTDVSAERSKLGAFQNRLEHTINNLGTSSENLTAAESRVRDVDMAKEMMAFTKNNILSQAATAMLAQANQTPQNVLQLLR